MNIKILNTSNDPIYLQIKNQIKKAILSNKLKADEQLPSIRFLAKELRVSVITTKRAYDELENEGFIYTFAGKGSYVSPQNEALLREEYLKQLETHLSKVSYYRKLLNLSIEEVIEILTLLADEDA